MELETKIQRSVFVEAAPPESELSGGDDLPALSSGWCQAGVVLKLLVERKRTHASWRGGSETHGNGKDGKRLADCHREYRTKRRNTMRLYVENIPLLANEEALAKWFGRAGLRVEAIDFVRKEESRGCAWVEIEGERFPSKALRHLRTCALWGQYLEVHKPNRETGSDWRHRADPWARLEAA